MLLSRYKTIIFIFLLSWVGAQSLALDHEFSEEHNQNSEQHFCLAQILDKDDFITPTTTVSEFKIELGIINSNLIVPSLISRLQLPFSARAPPRNIS